MEEVQCDCSINSSDGYNDSTSELQQHTIEYSDNSDKNGFSQEACALARAREGYLVTPFDLE